MSLFNPPTLLSLSAEIICKNISARGQGLNALPGDLKKKLLSMMSRRGTLDATSLSNLLTGFEKFLDLSESFLSNECLAATRTCRYLQNLNLNPGKNQIHSFNSQALLDLFPSLTRLSTLYMQRCPAVSDEVIDSVARNCAHLTQLDVGGCAALTDKSLNCIAEHLPRLTSLNISHSQITDLGLACLSQGRSQHSLKELLINNCTGITEKGVASIIGSCSKMKYFLFQGCPVSELVQQCLALSLQGNMRQISYTIH